MDNASLPSTCPCKAAIGSLSPSIRSTCPNHCSLLILIFSTSVSQAPALLLFFFKFHTFSLLLLLLLLLSQLISANNSLRSSSFLIILYTERHSISVSFCPQLLQP